MLSIYTWPIGILTGLFILKWFRHRFERLGWYSNAAQQAQRKRIARDKRREELLNLLRTKYSTKLPDPKITERIYQSTGVELLEGLRKKDFTYTQIVLVLSLRAIKIGQEINSTTEEFFDQAIQQAEKLDENHNDQQELLLKGIPVSIKDQIHQQGADSSMGITMRNFQPSSQDGILIQLLKEQGAFAGFVRTATIQGMFLPESVSETYGSAVNPFDRERTSGGSSGGEGALIAARGSPIGIGTDIGGSIRIPAHFCGVFGFKPTPGRVSYKDIGVPGVKNEGGESNIRATAGPLARCTDDLVLVMRSFLQDHMWHYDPALARQPWREERYTDKKRLTIGYYTTDNWFQPAPACVRAVNEAAEALRKLGHKVIPYTPVDIPDVIRLFVSIIGADGNGHFLEALEKEPLNKLYTPLAQASSIPRLLRPLIASLLHLFGERRNAMITRAAGAKTAYEYFDLIIDMKKYIKKCFEDMKNEHIDVLLAPVNGLPAYRCGQAGHLFHSCSYTFLFNILHVPAGVVPVTVVREDEQYYEDKNYNDKVVAMAKETCRKSAGLPIGVQIAGWPNDDERVLSVMKELEDAIGKDRVPMPDWARNIDIYTN